GILMEISKETIIMVATDTHRLAKGECKWQGEGEASLIMPCRTLQEIARLAVNEEENIKLTANKNQAYFRLGNLTFTSRVIVGQYPDYNQVLPSENLFSYFAVINNHRLCDALERAALISRDVTRGKGNIVRLNFEKNKVVMSAEVPDEGTIKEEIPAAVEGEELTVNYNARYLLEALKVIDEENICFRLTGATTPGIIVGDSEKEQNYFYLVLPVRVSR
ncbi:MAG: DNA polymerase III subunit beta, partial [Clostridiales bacterium]